MCGSHNTKARVILDKWYTAAKVEYSFYWYTCWLESGCQSQWYMHSSVRSDGDLQCTAAVHLVQSGLVVIKLEDVSDHALHLHLTAIKVSNGTREAICLRERTDNLGTQ